MKNSFAVFCVLFMMFFIYTPEAGCTDILIYASGNNTLGGQAQALRDICLSVPQGGTYRVLYQISYGGTAYRGAAGAGEYQDTALGPLDMGAPETLAAFLEWAENGLTGGVKLLVIWGHGNQWYPDFSQSADSIAYDAISASEFFMNAEDVEEVFVNDYDIILLDACGMASLENFHALKDSAEYVVASEHYILEDAFDYGLMIADYGGDKDAALDGIFDAFVNRGDDYSLTAVRTAGLAQTADMMSHYDMGAVNRAALGGIDMTNAFTAEAENVDLAGLPLCGMEANIVKRTVSDPALSGVAVFFPVEYAVFKSAKERYEELAFQHDASWLGRLYEYYAFDDIPPACASQPEARAYARYIFLDAGEWYDDNGVGAATFYSAVDTDISVPPLEELVNASGYARVEGGLVYLNGGDSARFSNPLSMYEGYVYLDLDYAVWPGERCTVYALSGGTARPVRYFSGIGSADIWLSRETEELLIEVSGPGDTGYRGVIVKSRLSVAYRDYDLVNGSGTVPYREGVDIFLDVRDSYGNMSLARLELIDDGRFIVYPNPATGGEINLGRTCARADVYDALGRRVMSVSNVSVLDISGLPKGVYWVRADGRTAKFVNI